MANGYLVDAHCPQELQVFLWYPAWQFEPKDVGVLQAASFQDHLQQYYCMYVHECGVYWNHMLFLAHPPPFMVIHQLPSQLLWTTIG